MPHIFRSVRLLVLSTALAVTAAAAPVITELMASNRQTLADNDRDFSDWIEIHNPDPIAVDLTGWYLTDSATRPTKWQFPSVSIPASGYLLVFASDKDRRTPGAPLHTNFALSADGEYLALVAADGATVVSEFAPAFPAQSADVSFGLAASGTIGFLSTPTPGASNSGPMPSSIPLVRADGTTENFFSTLPIVVLDNNGFGPQAKADGELAGSFQLVAGGTTFSSAAGLKIRGTSSANFPKSSFSIELHDEAGGNRSVSLLGMAKVADWALVASWQFDPSHLRNAYLYALSNSIGLWAPRTRFIEFFVNTDGAALYSDHYLGLGVLTERIKAHSALINLKSLDSIDIDGEAVTGGYIVKIDPADADEIGWTTERGIPTTEDDVTSLIVVSPKADKIAPEQQDYIQGYVQAFEHALFADRDSNWATRDYLDYIDRASWIDFHLLQVLSKNPDGLIRSTYFTKDRGGKLKAGPIWDFDRAMGSTDERSETWNEWNDPLYGAKLWESGWWGVLARDPDYVQAWIDRWQSLRRGALSTERLTMLGNSLATQIDPAAAERDAARWPENVSRFGNHRGEVDHLIAWLSNRANWIDSQFIAPPVAVHSDDGVQLSAPEGMLIAYTTDGSDPRASGGGLSETAAIADSFTVPAGTSATIRIYNPSAAIEGIGSPWSSPVVVAAPAEVPARPEPSSAQLSALSTRATLAGAGAKLVSGLIVSGDDPKTYVVRAVGRTLMAFGVADALLNPVLDVVAADGTVVASNADWREAPDAAALAQQFATIGAFPLSEASDDGRDAALLVTLAPGSYAIEVGSESDAAGTVLAEIHAADRSSAVKFLSAQAALAAGGSFVSGVSIGGTAPRDILLRAIGGTADATLAVYDGTRLLAANDDWSYAPNASAIGTAAARAGAVPLPAGSRDAALLLRLAPGTYTVQAGADDAAPGGIRLEIIELP